MKTNVYTTLLISILAPCFSISQEITKTSAHVKIRVKSSVNVTRVEKGTKTVTVPDSTIVTKQQVEKSGTLTYTITTYDTIARGQTRNYIVDKPVNIELGAFIGKANLTLSEDQSYIQVNYWLNKRNYLDKGDLVLRYERKLDALKGNKEFEPVNFKDDLGRKNKTKVERLTKDETIYMFDITSFYEKVVSENPIWYQQCKDIVIVYNDDTTKIKKIYAKTYDNNADYRITSENRGVVNLPSRNWSFGIVAVPFKYRFGYGSGEKKATSEFSANLNVGPYIGYTWGRYRVRFEKDKYVSLPLNAFTIGGFLNFGSVNVNAANSTAGKFPLADKEEKTIGIISPGIGFMYSINNINLGAFFGYDIGFGSSPRNWNFNNRLWMGFGLTYSLASFWAK